ncbi:MAG: restriction endonuclease subunit S [Proteobacteria bacterium]|nr:restriction endonuclease subunit S [Pseudomonadota bacterium]
MAIMEAITDNAFITFYPEHSINQNFLVWLLRATNLQQNTSATAQPVISGGKIYPLLVPLPPLSEQKRIVAKIDQLMALCDELETSLSKSQTDCNRLMEAAVGKILAA